MRSFRNTSFLSLCLLFTQFTPVLARSRGFFAIGFIGGPPVLTALFLLASVVLFVGVLFGAYGCYRYQQRKNWNRRVEDAQEAVLQDALKSKSSSRSPTIRSATYSGSFSERNGDPCTTKGTLEFPAVEEKFMVTSRDGKTSAHGTTCLSIRGHGTNSSGSFVVKRGRISPSGLCCWVEEADGPKESFHFFKERKHLLITGRITQGGSNFSEGRWASYHQWGGVTDGQLERLDLLNKVG
jgi:hypothetical protein